jgi:hypothetical protein
VHSKEKTSSRVASIASRVLQDPKSATTKDVKTLAASALTQAPDRKLRTGSLVGRAAANSWQVEINAHGSVVNEVSGG